MPSAMAAVAAGACDASATDGEVAAALLLPEPGPCSKSNADDFDTFPADTSLTGAPSGISCIHNAVRSTGETRAGVCREWPAPYARCAAVFNSSCFIVLAP